MAEPRELVNFVAGEPRPTRDKVTSPVVDPSTGEVIALAPVTGEADLDDAFAAATAGFAKWRETTPADRSLALLQIADALEARGEELLRLEVGDTGKPPAFFRSEELPGVIDAARYFAGAARMLDGRATGEYAPDHTSSIRREPVGVCAQVTPWNYPALMAAWKWAPAIAA